MSHFNRSTSLRNEFNHCLYITDDAGQIAHSQSMRIVETAVIFWSSVVSKPVG